MENPAYWGKAEKVVDEAIRKWEEGRANGVVGYSKVMSITTALRKAGYLSDAQAWEEGFEAGHEFASEYKHGNNGPSDPPKNPYDE